MKVPINKVYVTDMFKGNTLEIEELKANIAKNGIKIPFEVVAKSHGRYMVVNGKQRFLAAKALGYAEIEVIVLDRKQSS